MTTGDMLFYLLLIVALIIAIALMLAVFRLFSIDRTLKLALAKLEKAIPSAPESEEQLARRRAAVAEVKDNWLIK
jgi:predicted Holliday junction resolvase-like endonuclease